MLLEGLVFSPVSIMVLALLAGALIYLWAKTVAPSFSPTAAKVRSYVGGETMEPQVFRPGYEFFYVALFFTVIHVAALVIALAPRDAPLWGTLGYLAIIAVAVAILRWEL